MGEGGGGRGGRQFYTNQYHGVCIPAASGFRIFVRVFANRASTLQNPGPTRERRVTWYVCDNDTLEMSTLD